jgi:hypothetical protein
MSRYHTERVRYLVAHVLSEQQTDDLSKAAGEVSDPDNFTRAIQDLVSHSECRTCESCGFIASEEPKYTGFGSI